MFANFICTVRMDLLLEKAKWFVAENMRARGFGLAKSDRRQNWFTAEIFVKGQKVTDMSRLACISAEESRKPKGLRQDSRP